MCALRACVLGSGDGSKSVCVCVRACMHVCFACVWGEGSKSVYMCVCVPVCAL